TQGDVTLGSDDGAGSPVGRRVVLGMLGLGAAGVLVGSKVQDVLSRVLQPVTAADRTGLTSLIPAANHFRIYTVTGDLPVRSAAEYSLRVDGLVDHPLDLAFTDLQAMPSTRLVKDFQCVTGWRVPQVPWTGVRLTDVLDRAGALAGGKAVLFTSF